MRRKFPETITYETSETNSSFQVKQGMTRKAEFLFFTSFLLVLTKLSFWRVDWPLGYNSVKYSEFPDIF